MLKKLLKYTAYVLGGLILLVVGGGLTVFALTQRRLHHRYTVEPTTITSDTNAATLARGRHIAVTRACADCHGQDFGGAKVVDDPMIGRMHGPNLTPGQGGLSRNHTTADYVRAIRHGLAPDGRPLVLMPSLEYTELSDEDLGALIAYLRSLAPVDRPNGPVEVGPLARVLITAGEIKLAAEHIDHTKTRAASVVPSVTPAYGRYLATSCTGCHGDAMLGGKIPGAPPEWPAAANLHPKAGARLATWSEADFITTLRTHKRPDGTELSPVMPKAFAQMTDSELQALWQYLQSLPASPTASSG